MLSAQPNASADLNLAVPLKADLRPFPGRPSNTRLLTGDRLSELASHVTSNRMLVVAVERQGVIYMADATPSTPRLRGRYYNVLLTFANGVQEEVDGHTGSGMIVARSTTKEERIGFHGMRLGIATANRFQSQTLSQELLAGDDDLRPSVMALPRDVRLLLNSPGSDVEFVQRRCFEKRWPRNIQPELGKALIFRRDKESFGSLRRKTSRSEGRFPIVNVISTTGDVHSAAVIATESTKPNRSVFAKQVVWGTDGVGLHLQFLDHSHNRIDFPPDEPPESRGWLVSNTFVGVTPNAEEAAMHRGFSAGYKLVQPTSES